MHWLVGMPFQICFLDAKHFSHVTIISTIGSHVMFAQSYVCFRHGLCCSEVRVVERTTEGLHSTVARVLDRAPRANHSYLSLELRFAQIMHLCIVEPVHFRAALGSFERLVTLSGFRNEVLRLVFEHTCCQSAFSFNSDLSSAEVVILTLSSA